MKRNIFSVVVSLVALCLMLCLQPGSKAQTFNRAVSNGQFYMDGGVLTAVNVNVYQYTYDMSGTASSFGTMSIVGNTLALSTVPAYQQYNWVFINGVPYPHASITSKSFYFYANSYNYAFQAHLVVELTKYGSHGQGSFKIIRDSDNAVMIQSTSGGMDGLEVPFLIGSVSITM